MYVLGRILLKQRRDKGLFCVRCRKNLRSLIINKNKLQLSSNLFNWNNFKSSINTKQHNIIIISTTINTTQFNILCTEPYISACCVCMCTWVRTFSTSGLAQHCASPYCLNNQTIIFRISFINLWKKKSDILFIFFLLKFKVNDPKT